MVRCISVILKAERLTEEEYIYLWMGLIMKVCLGTTWLNPMELIIQNIAATTRILNLPAYPKYGDIARHSTACPL